MKYLHDSTITQLKGMDRHELLEMLVMHDKDGEYSDDHRNALGLEILTFEEALNLAIINLNEVNS